MLKDFKLLITKDVLDCIYSIAKKNKSIQQELVAFITFLQSGDWLSDETIQMWTDETKTRYFFAKTILDNLTAIWEPVSTIDVMEYYNLPEGQDNWKSEHFRTHHIVIYSIGKHSIAEDKKFLHLLDEIVLQRENLLSEFTSQLLPDQIYYNNQLYHLSNNSLKNILANKQEGLPIYLTPEQAEIIGYSNTLSSPILMSGEAGTGKTTIITHWLLIKYLKDNTKKQKILFVTFSEKLVDYTEETFSKMLTMGIEADNVNFKTYRELLLEIAQMGGLGEFPPEKEMTFERFLNEYAPKHIRKLDPVLVWDEIRSVIKGNNDISKKFMDLESYKELRSGRGQCNTPEDMRKKYHGVALQYRNYMDREGMWDGIDLAFFCIARINEQPDKFIYDWIACDEIQDLAPLEIEVLIKLLKNQDIDHIFFAGDVVQVINPSGFTWAKLKQSLFNYRPKSHYIKDAWHLERNFRSSVEIISLINQVLDVRQELLEDTNERKLQTSYRKSGLKPMVLKENPINTLKDLVSSPKDRMLLVKNKNQKEFIEKQLSEIWKKKEIARQITVLTVEEAKGLEWDGVLLWNFFIPRHDTLEKNEWENVFVAKKRTSLHDQVLKGEKSRYGLTYEFNLLHVGLTRARKQLMIYDEDSKMHILNMGDQFQEYTTEIEHEVFIAKWETKSPDAKELQETAMKLEERDFEQSKLLYADAAKIYVNDEDFVNAAKCFDSAHLYERAAECYRNLQDARLEKKMMGKYYEIEKKPILAANIYLEVADINSNVNDGESTNINEAMQFFDKAIDIFERNRFHDKAAETLEKKAAIQTDTLIKIRTRNYAVAQWEKAKKYDEALKVLNTILKEIEKSEDEYIVGYPRNEFLGKQYQKYAEIKAQVANADLSEVISYILDAAKYYNIMAQKKENIGEKILFFKQQKECLEKAGNWYLELGDVSKAVKYQLELIDIILKSNMDTISQELMVVEWWSSVILLLQKHKQYIPVKQQVQNYVEHLEKHHPSKMIMFLEEKITWFREEDKLDDIVNDMLPKLADYYEKNGKLKMAGDIWYEIGQLQSLNEELEIILVSMKSFKKAGENFLQLKEFIRCNECFTKGKEVGKKHISPVNVGWYCFKEIGLDYWIQNMYNGNKPKSELFEYLMSWIDKAVENFKINSNESTERLRIYEKKTKKNVYKKKDARMSLYEKKTKENVYKKKDARISLVNRIWTHYCIVSINQEKIARNISEDQKRSYEKLVKEEYRLIHINLGILKDMDTNLAWREHWKTMEEHIVKKLLRM